MKYIINFLPLIGVIIGFCLSSFKEYVQNKPKLKLELKDGKFNYYNEYMDSHGFPIKEKTNPTNAKYFELNLIVDIYNYGRGNTSVKDLSIETKVNSNYKQYLSPELRIKGSTNEDYSFNLQAGSIITLNIKLKVENKNSYKEFFQETNTLLLDNQDRLLFTVIAESINNKKYKLVVDPLSIVTA